MESIYHQILNLKEYFRLYDEADAMGDRAEGEAREKLLDAISSAITDYDVHIREYEYQQHGKAVLARGVTATPVPGEEIKALWDSLFAASVSQKTREEVFFDQFKWHLFSYQVLPALTGQKADQAFLDCPKGSVYVFFQHCSDAWRIENAHLLRPEDFRVDVPSPFTDVYLFDPEHRWSCIHTHEGDCGPYFCKS